MTIEKDSCLGNLYSHRHEPCRLDIKQARTVFLH